MKKYKNIGLRYHFRKFEKYQQNNLKKDGRK